MSGKAQAQQANTALKPFFQDAARNRFGGQEWKGFKFWAMSEVLIDGELSDDELERALELDGRGDLGLDGYIEDPDNQTLILVQSKWHDGPQGTGDEQISSFLEAMPKKLLDPHVVVASSNPLIQDAHRALKDAIAAGWRLRFIFLTAGWLTTEGSTYAQKNRSTTAVYDSVEIPRDLEIVDLPSLLALYESHLVTYTAQTDWEFDLRGVAFHESSLAGFKVIQATMPARQIVRAFKKHRFALFQLNPRGPLKSTTNARIRATLLDPVNSKLFYLFNNGITALCDSYRREGDRLVVRRLQIVNGCQTTVTLDGADAVVENDPSICVALKLIEGPGHWSSQIAESTNTQSRLTAQDFKSNDALQKDLRKQFDALPDPIFYEIKRGDWDFVYADKDQRARYYDKAANSHRRMKMKDLAQATLALLGDPGRAKDQSRAIFESQELYQKVFPAGIRAHQLLLPYTVYEVADELCDSWTFQGSTYARYCLVALAGSTLLGGANELPNLAETAALLSQPDRIARELSHGQQAIASVFATLGKEYPGHREFFRSESHFKTVQSAFENIPRT